MKYFTSAILFVALYTQGVSQQIQMGYPDFHSSTFFEVVSSENTRDDFEHDLKIEFPSVHFMGNQGYMYKTIPFNAQYYLNFSAKITNTGNNTELVQLQVQRTDGGFSALSAVVELQPDESSIFTIDGSNIWQPIPFGANLQFTALSDNSLENTNDDQLNFQYSVAPSDAPHMKVDYFNTEPNSITGQFTGYELDGDEQGIGVLFEKIGPHPFDLSHVQIAIANVPEEEQSQFINNNVYCKVWHFSDDTFTLLGQTESKSISANNFGTTIWLEALNNCIQTPAQGTIYVAACFNPSARVPIALSGQSLYQQVAGFNNDSFYWTPPIEGALNLQTVAPVIRPFFTCPLSLSNINASFESSIFPNPAKDKAKIVFDVNQSQNFDVTIIDLSGKTVKELNVGHLDQGAQTVEIDVNNLAPGVYFVNVHGSQFDQRHKLIVE